MQCSYSALISKIKIASKSNDREVNGNTFCSIHTGRVSLPLYMRKSSNYDTFTFHKNGTTIMLSRTNILEKVQHKEYCSYFSKSLFRNTLKKPTMCGEYNKTKKRSTPLYCYGGTITCTRYPKVIFFANGRPQILPRPYFTSKPGQKGSNLLNTSWMKSFFKEVESHVLHYLHNLCPDKEFRLITLLNIELLRKIILQCLRLGGSFLYTCHFWNH